MIPSSYFLILLLAVGMFLAYSLSSVFRSLLRLGQVPPCFPLNWFHRKNTESGFISAEIENLVGLWIFYLAITSVVAVTGGSLATALAGNARFGREAIVLGLLTASLTRALCLSYSISVTRALMVLISGAIAVIPFTLYTDPEYPHRLGNNILMLDSSSEFTQLFVWGSLAMVVCVELTIGVIRRISPKTRHIPYALLREYIEGLEDHDLTFSREDVLHLFASQADSSIKLWGLGDLCWKTLTGPHKVAEAILDAVATAVRKQEKGTNVLGFEELRQDEQDEWRGKAREKLRLLNQQSHARVFMPLDREKEREDIERTLGFDVCRVPEVGIKRYLVINRRIAVISLSVPYEKKRNEQGVFRSASGSNIAVATDNPTRVQECMADADGLWATYHCQSSASG